MTNSSNDNTASAAAPMDDGCNSDEEGGLRVDENIYIPPAPKLCEVSTNGVRLMISRIVNTNFKSYANTQTVGPFHQCFSAIVGPNGSGKSNVIDSMLFVFGYRASRVRAKKVSELIHSSSEHPNCRSCSVSVHFQEILDKNDGTYEIIPQSEFVITRTAFKDSTSFYELNGKRVQFKEIAKVLRKYGVDLDHNRFLILQGEVEQIAMMNPKGENDGEVGLLEFLEDIIGTNRYKEPLVALGERVEELTNLKSEKLNRLWIVENEKKELLEPMKEAVDYLEKENEITKLQHQLYHYKKVVTNKELSQHREAKKEIDEDVTKLVEEMKKVKEDIEEKNGTMKEKSKRLEGLRQQKDKVTAKYDEMRKKDEAIYAELVETNKRRKNNIASLKNERDRLEKLSKVPEKNAKSIAECEEHSERAKMDLAREEDALKTLMSGLREKIKPLLEKRSGLEKQLIERRQIVSEKKAKYDVATSKLNIYTSIEKTEKEKLEKLEESVNTKSETLKESQRNLEVLQKKIPATEKSLAEARSELEQVKQQELQAATHLRNARGRMEEQRAAMNANKSRNRVLDSIMSQKKLGRFPGVFGRLGDLGGMDAKYDVAMSTACGPLDNIVVDTITSAEECIEYLRENNIGRATFIALDKQQRFLQQCKERISAPEGVPRLFDLIKVEDEKFLPAFYYAIQNTLVAKDLEQATRIAYGAQRYRVVTLQGELIEMSGTMSGGGKTVSRGRIGQKALRNEPTAADIGKLEEELEKVYQKYNDMKLRQEPLENQVLALTTALRDMNMDRDRLRVEVKGLSEELPLLRKQLENQKKVAKNSIADPKETAKLEKVVEETKKVLDSATEDSESISEQVSAITEKIDKMSGDKIKEQQKKVADLKAMIDKTKAEILKLQVAVKTAERDSRKAEQKIESLEQDVKACEDKIREKKNTKVELEEEAKVLLDQLKEATEALQERDDDTAVLKEELDALHKRENKMKALKIDLDLKVKKSEKTLGELQHRVNEFSRKIAHLKLHEIPDKQPEVLKDLTDEESENLDERQLAAEMQGITSSLPKTIPNMQIIADYREKDELYIKRAAELEEIRAEHTKYRNFLETVRRQRIQEFLSGFSLITTKLKEMYRMITLGGDAELELVDTLDPFSEGIVFSVRPPKKSWKNIHNLSGGEKTLSSLALVFALHHYKPTPLYFMDEIDAALDFKNVSIVAHYIKERTKNAQFIVISLRSNMFELANFLTGIYKTYNCTKCVPLDVEKTSAKANIRIDYHKTSTQVPQQRVEQQQFLSQPNMRIASTSNEENENQDVRLNLSLSPSPQGRRQQPREKASRKSNGATNESNDSNDPDSLPSSIKRRKI